MFDPLFIFLSLIVFCFWMFKENETQECDMNCTIKHTDGTINIEDKDPVKQIQTEGSYRNNTKKIIQELEEEQQALIRHLKKAIEYGDNESFAHSLAEKKILHLEEEVICKENENRNLLDKLAKKESILLTISEQKLQYKKTIDKLLIEQQLLNQQIEMHYNEILNNKREIDRLREQLSLLDTMKTNKLSTLVEVDHEICESEYRIGNAVSTEDYETGTRL